VIELIVEVFHGRVARGLEVGNVAERRERPFLGARLPIRADCEKPPFSLPGSPIEYLRRLLGILGLSVIHHCDADCGVPFCRR